MTNLTSRSTTSRTAVAAAAVAAASALAACGSSSSNTAADAPTVKSSSATTSAAAKTPSASPSTSSAAPSTKPAPKATQQQRASRDEARVALKKVNWTQAEVIPSKTVYVYSANLPKGTSKVTQAGQQGLADVTYTTLKQGGKVVSTKYVDAKVTKAAVRRVITVGTGVQQAAEHRTATPQQVSRTQVRQAVTKQAAPTQHTAQRTAPAVKKATTAPAAKKASAAAPAAGNAGYWHNIARCESGNNWKTNTGNGFYGGLQFTQQTWAGFGGTAYAPRADLASPAQQMAIANKVLAVQGPGAWPVCSR